MSTVHGKRRSTKGIDQRLVGRAVLASWMEHLFSVESMAAGDGRRHERRNGDLQDALPGDNGLDEYLRLQRLSEAWRARKLMVLGAAANTNDEVWIDGVARRRWADS